ERRVLSGSFLPLHSAGSAAFEERVDLRHGKAVEITGDGMLEAACGPGRRSVMRDVYITRSGPHGVRALRLTSFTPSAVALGLCRVCGVNTTPSSRKSASSVGLP